MIIWGNICCLTNRSMSIQIIHSWVIVLEVKKGELIIQMMWLFGLIEPRFDAVVIQLIEPQS